MKIVTRVKNGTTCVEVIDPSDNTVTHSCEVDEGQQCVVVATACDSPADIEFGGREAIVEPEAEAAEAGESNDGEGEQSGEAEGEGQTGQAGQAEGAEAPADGEQPDGEGSEGEQAAA